MILEKVSEEVKKGMKAGNKEKVLALKNLKAELENNLKEKKPKDELEVVTSYKNKLVKAKGAYQGMKEKEAEIEREITFVKEYLPEQMSDQAVDSLIKDVIKGLGEKKNMGLVMKAVVPLTKGKYDGSKLSQRVLAQLQG